MGDVARQANSFVGTLAQLQDSEKILASNEQAAREALTRLDELKREYAVLKERNARLAEESRELRLKNAAESEAQVAKMAAMKEQAQREYDATVSAGAAKASEAVRGVREQVKEIEREIAARRREMVEADAEAAKHREALVAVRKEMDSLRARLTP